MRGGLRVGVLCAAAIACACGARTGVGDEGGSKRDGRLGRDVVFSGPDPVLVSW